MISNSPMKLFNSLTAVAVAGISIFSAPAAMAFWGPKMPTYSWLEREGNILQTNQKNFIYESDGWITGSIEEDTGKVRKIKLVGCRQGKCIYYMRVADDRRKYKFVSVQKVECATKKNSIKQQGEWTPFTKILFEDGYNAKAYRSFC